MGTTCTTANRLAAINWLAAAVWLAQGNLLYCFLYFLITAPYRDDCNSLDLLFSCSLFDGFFYVCREEFFQVEAMLLSNSSLTFILLTVSQALIKVEYIQNVLRIA